MPCRSAAISLLLLLSASALAQRAGIMSFQRLAIPDDVPAHLCSAIAQDARGFLWFGTQRGLVRYDGYEYRAFRSNPADAKTLPGNYVRALLVARVASALRVEGKPRPVPSSLTLSSSERSFTSTASPAACPYRSFTLFRSAIGPPAQDDRRFH